MTLRFGTDGVRGVANVDLTVELVTALGRAAARELRGETFLLGRDTRRSGPMLAAALAAGIAAEGCDVVDFGVLPTPGIAWLATQLGHPAAVISASHNPFADNGIKLLSARGTKLPDETERAIEAELDAIVAGQEVTAVPSGAELGEIVTDLSGVATYAAHLVGAADPVGAAPLRVVLDCANGAASAVAPQVLRALGYDVAVISAEPDGTNINAHCGSTDPSALQRSVVAAGADVGLSFDGDADRLIAVDDQGDLVDGDVLIALFAADLLARDRLTGGGVVITVMANLGLRRALEAHDVKVVETALGDRNVVVALDETGYILGGEQSGHIVFADERTTGDGILTGLHLLSLVERSGRRLSALAAASMTRVPQELRNVAVRDPARVAAAPGLQAAIADVAIELEGSGRVLVRASGTERAVRIMVEADLPEVASATVERLVAEVEREARAG